MAKRGYSAEQIIGMLREAEVLNAQGRVSLRSVKDLGSPKTPTVEYNTFRPHSSLNYRPPAPEAVQGLPQ